MGHLAFFVDLNGISPIKKRGYFNQAASSLTVYPMIIYKVNSTPKLIELAFPCFKLTPL